MADEEKKKDEKKAPEAEAEGKAEEKAPEAEEKAEEKKPATPKEVDAPAAAGDEKASADEGAGGEDASSDGEADAPEAEGGGAEDASSDEAAGEDDETDWKTRRRLERSRQAVEARPQTSPEDRAKERTERRGKAVRTRSSYRKKQRTKRERGSGTEPAERQPISAKARQGRVVSSKPDKTITVAIDIVRRHPSYEKIVRRSRTVHAHDAQNEASEGDLVRVVETRPLSRTKRWRLVEILEKAK